MPRPVLMFPALLLAFAAGSTSAAEWTYRGTLSSYGKPAQGVHLMRLTPYADASGGQPLAPSIDLRQVEVRDGRFAVDLDFADAALQSGPFWLAVEVARPGEDFHALPVRQPVDLKGALSVCWDTLGNVATDPGSNFIGTLDATALALRVNDVQAGLIVPSTNSNSSPPTPNLVFGASGNAVNPAAQGSAIGGGGRMNNTFAPNLIFDSTSTIAGGIDNRVGTDDGNPDNQNSSFVGGGFSNEIDANFSVIVGGRQNNVRGTHGAVGGGQNNEARAAFSTIPGGFQAVATRHGQFAYSAGGFAATPGSSARDFGSAQTSVYIMRREGSGALELSLDGDAPDSESRLVLATDQTIAFDILIAARDVADGQSASYAYSGVIKNVAGTTTLVGASATPTAVREDVAAWGTTIAANDAQDALIVTGTNGGTGESIRWVATIRTSEVAMDDL